MEGVSNPKVGWKCKAMAEENSGWRRMTQEVILVAISFDSHLVARASKVVGLGRCCRRLAL